MTASSPTLVRPWQWGIALIGCLFAAVIFQAAAQSLVLQALLVVAATGTLVLLLAPQFRITLVVLWILVHPLSIEKVFRIAESPHANFMPTFFVFSASDIFFYLLLLHLGWEAAGQRFKTLHWPRAATPFALLCLWLAILFAIHDKHGMPLIQLAHWLKMLAFLVMLPMAVRTRSEFLLVLAALALAIFTQDIVVGLSRAVGRPLSFITLFSAGSQQAMGFSGGSTVHVRATGTFGHVNQQAGLHVFFTLPLLGLVYARNTLWRVFSVIAIVGSMLSVLLTFSRSAWVAICFAFAVMLSAALLKGRMRREYWYTLGVLVVSGLLLVSVFWKPITDRIFGGDEGASASRIRMLVTSSQLLVKNPLFGVGPGNFIEASLRDFPLDHKANRWLRPNEKPQYEAIDGMEAATSTVGDKTYLIPLQVHNKYVLITVELGLVGLILFVWYQVEIFRAAWKTLLAQDPVLWWSAVGLFGACMATQVYFMFELVYDDKSMLILLTSNALMLALSRIVREERVVAPSPRTA